MALEPRLMYDGAAAATITTVAGNQPHTDASAGSSSGSSSASSAPTSAAPATDHAADHPATPSPTPTDTSTASTPADGSAGGGSPAAPTTPSSTAGHQIVFIDGNVPDAQALAQGVQPGIEVVILDPNSNGVQQIADYLTSHNEQNLDAIQIVSHGEEATVRLGNTIFGLADISMFSSQLAIWGNALKPGGDINLYGCNVAEGLDGVQFEVQLSMATGGAHVAASSGLVGAAALGGSWNLNMTLGTNDVGNPFTATTLAQYDDILTNQIWFSTNNGAAANNEVATANANGSGATSVNAMPPGINGNSLANWNNASIAVDAPDGLYFIANNPAGVPGAHQQIFEGNISGSGGLTAIYTTPDTNGPDFLGGMVYNAANHKLYFVVDDNTAPNGFAPGGGVTIDTGIFSLNIAANGTTSGLTKLVSWGAGSGAVNPHDIAIDNADNLLFFTDYGDSQDSTQTYNPRIEVANLTTGAIINSNLRSIAEPSGGAYYFYGIDIDPASHKLYWVTGDPAVAANNQIFGASFNASTGALTGVTALYTGSTTNLPISLAIDAANGVYYAGFNNGVSPTTIIEGSLSTPGGGTTILTFGPSTKPGDVFYEPAPVLTVSGSPATTPGGSAVDLSSSLTLVDTVQNIASASVTISANHQAGDTLAATTAGTSITASFNSTTGVLSLTGVDTAAHYQSVLDSVTFATTSSASTSRTFSWSTTDGHLASATPTTTAAVNLPPVVTAGASVTFNGGGPAVVLDSSLNVTDSSSANITGATISISSGFLAGDTLNFTAQNGISIASNVNGVLTLTGTASIANYKAALESVTYSFSGGGDPTNGGSATSRTVSWTVKDGNNVSNSPAATSTLTLVHTAPTVTASGTVSFTGGGSAVTLDSGLSLTNLDSTSLVSATISISSGFQSGIDVLSVNLAQSAGKITGTNITVSYDSSTGVLSLTGSDSFTNYQNALDHVQYNVPANADPTNGGGQTSRTISWSVKDNNSSNNTSNTGTSSLTTVHTAPSLSIAGSPQYSAGGAAVGLLSAVTLSDADSGGNLAGAVVSISSGFLSGDALNFTAQNGITIQSNVNGVLTLTGSSSIANYAAALQSITFSSSAGDPTSAGTDNSRTITWQVKDASTTNGSSNVSQLTLGISAQPPSITGTAGVTATYFADGNAVTLDGSVGVTDLASTTLSGATVSITGNFLLGDMLTADTTGTSITARYDRVHGVLILSGSDTLAHYQTVLDRIAYSSTAPDPTAGASANTRTISWQVNDGRATNNLSSVVTTSVDVTHIAPVETAGGSVPWTPGNGAVVVDSTVTVTDADINHSITTATVTISSGRVSGDTLAFNGGTNTESFIDGSTITGTYNSTTGVLTLTAGVGTPSAADFQLALQGVTFNNSSSNVSVSNPGGTRTLDWTVTTSVASSVTTHSTVVPTTPSSNDASSFPSGTTTPPGGTSGLILPPGGTSAFNTSGIGTLVSGTSGIVTLGTSTSAPGTFSYSTSGAGTFDPTLFGSGAGGPGYFDPGGGFGSGLDFGSTFTTASNDAPVDSESPFTLVADSSLGFGFDQKTDATTDRNADKGVDDVTPEKAVAVAEKDAASPDPVPAAGRFVPADTAPVAGKVGLSAQLRAAGRHGFLHDRLALLKSLHSVRG
ncbi:MAG TPA: DUF4347 domain-containing protein [Reyranella sp.]